MVGSGLFEAFDGGVHGLAGHGEGAGSQHFNLLRVLDFGASVDDFLSGLLKLLGEVLELQHLSFDEGVPQLLYGSVDDELVRLSELEDALSKGMKGGLRTLTRSCAQFNHEYWVSFTHGEVGARAGVVEYKAYVFGLALVVVSVINGRRDAKSSIGPIFDERWPWVCVTCGIIDNILIHACYYDWGCRRSNTLRQRRQWRGDMIGWRPWDGRERGELIGW